jgi:Mg-chelatase subunit ChlD
VPPGATQAGEASGAGPAGAAPSGETPPGAAPTKKPLPVPAASGELSVKGAGVPAEASGSGGAPSGAEDVRTGSGIAWDPDLRQVAEALVSVRAAAVREAKEKEKAGAVARAMRRRGERLATGLHQGIRVFANREFSLTQEDREKYRRLEAETHWLAQSMSRQWQQWVMGEQPLRETGLYSGKLDGRRLWRHDTRLFYRRNGPAGGGDLAILLLVDESGSMKESARWHHAQRACLVLEAVCRACRLPFAVLGHLAVYGQPHVVHHHYLDFGPRPADHRERLVMLGPKENTREGLSLRYAAEYIREAERAGMLGVVGQVRPLILSISDGRPVHDAERWTLKGAAAQADARAAVRELARDGIHVIGVAIGDEPSAIGEVYPHALEVRRVEDLPQRLLRTLRQWAEAGLNQGSL